MQTALVVVLWLLTVILAAFLGYVASYMKKKGENLATHEDIDKLVDQMKAVTQATKEIEAKISGEVWDRQKRWEMKREVIFEAIKRVANADEVLLGYSSALKVEQQNPGQDWTQAFLERTHKWSNASAALDESRLLVGVVCSRETKEALDSFAVVMMTIAAGIGKKDAQIYDKSREQVAQKLFAVRAALRKELGIE
jgi:hypothetical protein